LAPTIPTSEPSTLTAGETWKWTFTDSTYPASEGWSPSYAVRGVSALDITDADHMTDDGAATWTVTVPHATTDDLVAGVYEWVRYATKAAEKYVTARGSFVVLADADSAAAGDRQSHAEKMLARIEAEIEARLSGDGSAHESYTIGTAAGGRQLSKVPLSELYALKNKYAAEAQQAQRAGKLAPVTITFGRF
jgi:hypothetical protein